MSDILFSANIVLPLFFLVAIGYILNNLKLWDASFLSQANRFCFRALLPTMIFYNIYQSDFSSAFDPQLLLFAILGTLIVFFLCFLLVPLFIKQDCRRGVVIQALFRSNLVLLGVPLCQAIYGSEGAGLAAVVCAFIIPLFNVLAIICLAVYDKENATSIKKVLKSIATNPLIIGSVLGILIALAGIKLPTMLEKTISSVSSIGTPLALIILGATFNFKSAFENGKIIFIVTLLKIAIIPGLMLMAAALMGFSGPSWASLIAVFGSPIATASYVMACNTNADGELAGQLVVSTTLFSSITIFLFILIGRSCGLL